MIVVSNTSPLTNLAAIRQFELLRLLYAHIHIPEAVREELHSENTQWPGSTDVAAADWVEIHTVRNRSFVHVLQRDLDLGESESIALAVELGSDMVLIDEKEGRHAAQRLGLNVMVCLVCCWKPNIAALSSMFVLILMLCGRPLDSM